MGQHAAAVGVRRCVVSAACCTLSELLAAYHTRLTEVLRLEHRARVSRRSEPLTDGPRGLIHRGVALFFTGSIAGDSGSRLVESVVDTLEVETSYQLSRGHDSLADALDFEDSARRALVSSWDGQPCASLTFEAVTRERVEGFALSTLTFTVRRVQSNELRHNELLAAEGAA